MDNKNKKIIRFLILIIPAMILTWWFFYQIGGFLNIVLKANFTSTEKFLDNDINNHVQGLLENKIENIDSFLKIPVSLLQYKIYVKSNVSILLKNKVLYLPMRVKVGNQYEEIDKVTGQSLFFNKILKNPSDIKDIFFSISFKSPSIPFIINDDTYTYGIFPTTPSIIIVFVSFITIVHAFYFLIYKWYVFVIHCKF